MLARHLIAWALLPSALSARAPARPPDILPAAATMQLASSLKAAGPHSKHVWRDVQPTNVDGTVNGYIEISRGDRRKWEFNMAANERAIDRVISERVGGFPVNYGFVPQTVSYDGDPFDVLVLGPPLDGGQLVRGAIVGLLHMEDEKGLDSKVLLSPVDANGRATHELSTKEREDIAEFFRTYKIGEPDRFSKVSGWASAPEGRAYVTTTHTFFKECRQRAGTSCRIAN